MTGAERGFLLLTSHLGNPDRKPLTLAQLRELAQRAGTMTRHEHSRHITPRDLMAMGYGEAAAAHMVALLQDEQLLDHYIMRAARAGCRPITRASERYPVSVRRCLGLDSPGTLWAKGDVDILQLPRIALVGSRDLQSDNAAFAVEVGRQAARQGYALVSGNARGADKLAQNACLEAGGVVISVVADSLLRHIEKNNVLYLTEHDFDEPFSPQRAISRNRVIHSLGSLTFVAQARLRQGGTWDGTRKNLHFGWSPVYCYADGSPAQLTLADMGAGAVDLGDLQDMAKLQTQINSLFDQ